MRGTLKRLLVLMLVLALAVSIVGCKSDEPAETDTPQSTQSVNQQGNPKEDETQKPDEVDNIDEATEPVESKDPVGGLGVEIPTNFNPNYPRGDSWQVTYMDSALYLNSFGSLCITGVVAIRNMGDVTLYLDDSAFNLSDENGIYVVQHNFANATPRFIEPGETGYLWADGAIVDSDVDAHINYTFEPDVNVTYAEVTPIKYQVSDVEFTTDSTFQIKMTCKVNKAEADDYDSLNCEAVLFDKAGHVLGVVSGKYDGVTEAGDYEATAVGFFMDSLRETNCSIDDIDHYEVFAYPIQYNW